MDQVITAIPIYSDSAAEKVAKAEMLLLAAASESIDVNVWTFFKTQPVGIGGVPFLDMRESTSTKSKEKKNLPGHFIPDFGGC